MAVCSELLGQVHFKSRRKTNVEVTMKKMSRRKMTSVIDAIENIAIMSWGRLSAMTGCVFLLGRLVEQIHEFHSLTLKKLHDTVDA